MLSHVDALVLLEVYAAGETPIAGADSRSLARAIRARGRVEPVFVDDPADINPVLEGLVQSEDIVAMLGAGNIGQLAEELVA